ncbi:MAG: DMT family transporter [Deltaproteobacteria bacterium]|nr:DMT family transporter [Deltaproteobacteria bacterium]
MKERSDTLTLGTLGTLDHLQPGFYFNCPKGATFSERSLGKSVEAYDGYFMKEFNERLTLKVGLLTLLTAILWGGMNVSAKISLAGVPPFALAGIRFIIGSIVVCIWTVSIRIPLRLERIERGALIQLAVLFIVQICFLYVGTNLTLASRASILNSSYPFFTALFAHVMLKGDRLSRLKIIGIILSFSGVVLIFGESLAVKDLGYLAGDLLVLASGLLLGFRFVYIKRLTQSIHPGKLLLWQGAFSIPVFLLLSYFFEQGFQYQITAWVVVGILYQGLVIAGFCFILSTILLRRYMASRLAVFHFVTPIVGVVFSNLLLGEGISPWIIASMLLVGMGIAIVNSEG